MLSSTRLLVSSDDDGDDSRSPSALLFWELWSTRGVQGFEHGGFSSQFRGSDAMANRVVESPISCYHSSCSSVSPIPPKLLFRWSDLLPPWHLHLSATKRSTPTPLLLATSQAHCPTSCSRMKSEVEGAFKNVRVYCELVFFLTP